MLGVDNNRPFITIFIRQSKTDRQRRGTFRTSYGADSTLCPVKAAVRSIAAKRGRYGDNDVLFPERAIGRIRDHLRLAARIFGLPEHRLSCHSIRSGGATSLFVSGIPLSDIQRFGRWRSIVFHEYLRLDDLQYRHLISSIANAEGLTEQLRLAVDSAPQTQFADQMPEGEEDEERFRKGCFRVNTDSVYTTPLEMRWRSPGSSPYDSSDEWRSVGCDTDPLHQGRRRPIGNALTHHPGSVAQ